MLGNSRLSDVNHLSRIHVATHAMVMQGVPEYHHHYKARSIEEGIYIISYSLFIRGGIFCGIVLLLLSLLLLLLFLLLSAHLMFSLLLCCICLLFCLH